MKKITVCLMVAIFTILLVSCKNDEKENDNTVSTNSPAVSDTTIVVTTSEEMGTEEDVIALMNKDAITLAFPKGKKINLPEKAQDYEPEMILVPVIGTDYGLNFYCTTFKEDVTVKENFYNTKEKQLEELPKGATCAYLINDQCYLLFDENDKAAVMRLDGTMVTDYSYSCIDYDGWVVNQAHKGNVELGILNENQDTETLRCLLNIQTGDIIASGYTWFEYTDEIIIAYKDRKTDFIDYNGNIIYSVADNVEKMYHTNSPSRGSASKFYYEESNGTIYSPEPDLVMSKCGAYYVVLKITDFEYGNYQYSIFDLSGKNIVNGNATTKCCIDNQNNIFIYKADNGKLYINMLTPDGAIKKYTLDCDITQLSFIEYKNEKMYVHSNVYENGIHVYNNAGELIEIKENTYIQNNDGSVPYIDKYLSGEFIITITDEKITAIHNKNDNMLLIENPYGAVLDYVTDKMIVYKDKNTCGFLYSDGKYEEIPTPTIIKK